MDTGGKGFVSKSDLLRIAKLKDPALGITEEHAQSKEAQKLTIPEAESEDSDDFFAEKPKKVSSQQ